MKKIRVGVFGGYRGMTMIGALAKHPDAELVAVCDKFEPVLEKVKKFADENGCKVELFRSFDDFIEYDMDAVIMANYANEHATFAIRALKKGKHVMTEVLPCETMAQAVELIETVEETGLVYAYAENYCYMLPTFEMWKKYEKGEIGEVQYGEGEYIHDCTSIWPDITYGERNHWRNMMHPNFYCTHSIGPMLTVTGLRPVRVVGFETNPNEQSLEMGFQNSTGIEMITLENGAILKSIHGGLKREPGSVNYMFYGKKGMMESGRYNDKIFNIYKEGEEYCRGDWDKYDPVNEIAKDKAELFSSHGGSDFYATHFFIEKILGTEEGKKWSIDVYKAVDMGICGLLAYRSVLNGNIPMEVPNFRNKEERDKYRNDNACTTPAVAGDQLLPRSSYPIPEIPDETYENVRNIWLNREKKRAEEAAKKEAEKK